MGGELQSASRRSFLRGRSKSRKGHAESQAQRGRQGVLPPIAAFRNTAVLPDCAACDGACQAACAQEIVQRHPIEHRLSGVPYLDFSQAGCTSCGDCAVACPAQSTEATSPQALGKVAVDAAACLALNGVFCMSCIGQCEAKALTLDARRRLSVKREQCTGCGMCIHACPVMALIVVSEPDDPAFQVK